MSFISLPLVRASWAERPREKVYSVVVTVCSKLVYSKPLIAGVIHSFAGVLVRYAGQKKPEYGVSSATLTHSYDTPSKSSIKKPPLWRFFYRLSPHSITIGFDHRF